MLRIVAARNPRNSGADANATRPRAGSPREGAGIKGKRFLRHEGARPPARRRVCNARHFSHAHRVRNVADT